MAAYRFRVPEPQVRFLFPHPERKLNKFKEGSCTTETTIATLITEAGETFPALLSLVWKLATGNPLLTLITVSGLAGIGFSLFKRAKKTVR